MHGCAEIDEGDSRIPFKIIYSREQLSSVLDFSFLPDRQIEIYLWAGGGYFLCIKTKKVTMSNFKKKQKTERRLFRKEKTGTV